MKIVVVFLLMEHAFQLLFALEYFRDEFWSF